MVPFQCVRHQRAISICAISMCVTPTCNFNVWFQSTLSHAGESPTRVTRVMHRVGQNNTFIGIYGVHTVSLAGKSPYIRSYTVQIYGVHMVFIAGNHRIYSHIRCRYTVLANPTRDPSLLFPKTLLAVTKPMAQAYHSLALLVAVALPRNILRQILSS